MKLRTDLIKFAAVVALAALLLTGCGRKLPEQTTAPTQTQEQILPTDQTQPPVVETTAPETTQTEPAPLKLTLESVEEKEQLMVVTTSYCVVRYPFAFSDIIQVEVVEYEGSETLMFRASLNGESYPMFCLMFDGVEGSPVGNLTLNDGSVVSVTAQIFPGDESLDSDMLHTFYAAQESINDVISSLMDSQWFVPAQ